jgi:steroid delta-isomerase-like uncharacterized protein
MSTPENKAIIRRFFEEGLSTGDMALLDEIVAQDFTLHGAPPGLPSGREDFKLLVGMFRSAFPDYRDSIEDLVAEGDKVVVRWTFRGTHTGDFQGIPATGKHVKTTGISIFRVHDGKIKDDWTIIDMVGLLQQLGAVPLSE